MKHLVTAALALALAGSAASALADPPDQHHPAAKPPAPHGAPPHGAPAHGAPPVGGHGVAPGGFHPPVGGGHAPAIGGAASHALGGGAPAIGARGAVAGGHAGLGFHSHALRPSDQGRSYYSPGAFRQQYSAQRRFRAGNYAYPGGWYARSWSYGDYLPFGWFAPAYYLDWGDYQLPEPPIGCEWVREGPDAVLVDVWTGEVLSVDDGVFY